MKKIRVLTATDIHQSKWMYRQLIDAVRRRKPDVLALVGDFLYAGEPSPSLYSEAECARHLAKLPCEIVFTRGNHEMNNWDLFAKPWIESGRLLHVPHGDATAFGPLVLVGFPCTYGNEESFLMGRKDVNYDATTWFPALFEQYGPAALTLWLLHEPPAGTKLVPQRRTDGRSGGMA